MLLAVVLLSSAAYLIWYVVFRKTDLPPGPCKLPLIGNAWWFLLQKRKKIRIPVAIHEAAKTYGDVIHFQIGNKNIVFLQGFDTIHDAFVKQAADFSFRPNRLNQNTGGQSKGVVMENGEPFKIIQSFIVQFLNSEIASVEHKILAEINAATEYLDAETDDSYDMKLLVGMMMTNIIHNVVFDKRFDYADEDLNCLLTNLGAIFRGGSKLDATAVLPAFLVKLLKTEKREREQQETRKAGEWVKDHINKEIDRHKATFDGERLRDFVDVYIKEELGGSEKETFTRDRLHQVIKDMFVAGSEASAVTMNWVILHLQEFPEVQEKCQREITAKCGNRSTCLEDRGSLPFVESTLMEIQRISNVAEATLPHSVLEDTTFRGYRIPKDSIVHANLLSSNKERRYWDDPDIFLPDRFLQDKAKKNPAFIPFGLGPRRCLGESLAKKQIFLIFTNFLQRFTFLRGDPNVRHSFNCIVDQLTATPLPYKTRIIKRK